MHFFFVFFLGGARGSTEHILHVLIQLLSKTLRGHCYYNSHLTGKETESRRGSNIFLWSRLTSMIMPWDHRRMYFFYTGPERRLRPKPLASPLLLPVSHSQPVHCVYLQNILRTEHFFITSTTVPLNLDQAQYCNTLLPGLVSTLVRPTLPHPRHPSLISHTINRVILLKHKSDYGPFLLKWFFTRCRVEAKSPSHQLQATMWSPLLSAMSSAPTTTSCCFHARFWPPTVPPTHWVLPAPGLLYSLSPRPGSLFFQIGSGSVLT